MEIATIINLIANSLITIGMTFFIIAVFGRRSKVIESMNFIERLFLKTALCASAAGALLNVLTLSTPSMSESLLNVGMGILFTWAAWFHWKYFVKKKQ